MDGVQQSHDDYVNSSWIDIGTLQQQHGQHAPLSPHHPHNFGDYTFVESPGFAPPDSPFRLQPPPAAHQGHPSHVPIAPNYLGMQQWGQTMPPPPPPVTSTHQQFSAPPAIAPAPAPPQPVAATLAAAAAGNPTQTSSSPRRTLTDADRRRMCLFHEENPNVKQTEIGAMFGVERSTVSKVLRQKEKYLFPDDGSRSPVKRSKGKFPDIERALSVWAKNTRKQGIALTDMMIREKAKFFAISVGISDNHFKANSAGWLEKFKQKNNLHPNGRGRSESDVTGIARGSAANPTSTGSSHARTDSTPTTSNARDDDGDSPMMQQSKSQESNYTNTNSPDSFVDFSGGGLNAYHHQQSSGPTTPSTPFFSESGMDSAQPSPAFPSQQARVPHAGIQQRPRSQTFPLINVDPSYISPPPSSEPLTPKILNQTIVPPPALGSPVADISNPLASPHGTPSSSNTISANETPSTPMTMGPVPSTDEARRALEVVMSFLRQQPLGFVEPDDYVVVQKLLRRVSLNDGTIETDSSMAYSSVHQ